MLSRLIPFVSGTIFQQKIAQAAQMPANIQYTPAGLLKFVLNQFVSMGKNCAVIKDAAYKKKHTTASAFPLIRFGNISDTITQLNGASPNVKAPVPISIGISVNSGGQCC